MLRGATLSRDIAPRSRTIVFALHFMILILVSNSDMNASFMKPHFLITINK